MFERPSIFISYYFSIAHY